MKTKKLILGFYKLIDLNNSFFLPSLSFTLRLTPPHKKNTQCASLKSNKHVGRVSFLINNIKCIYKYEMVLIDCTIPPSSLSPSVHTQHYNNNDDTHRAPYYPTQGVPGSFIEPVEELIKAIGGEMVSRPVVEPAFEKDREREKGAATQTLVSTPCIIRL